MPFLTGFDISGSGVHDLGAYTNVVDLGVKITTLPTDANIWDDTYPQVVSRVGWVAIAADYSFDTINIEPIYEAPMWIDCVAQLFTFRPEEVGCRYIRWWLRGAAAGHIRVDT